MADLVIPKGDKGFYLNFTVRNDNETAFDLTGYTIGFKVWKKSKSDTILVSGTPSIVLGTAGTCRYLVGANDFGTVTPLTAELELTQAGVIESTVPFSIEVQESG